MENHTFESTSINHKKGKNSLTQTHFWDTKKRFTQHAPCMFYFWYKEKKNLHKRPNTSKNRENTQTLFTKNSLAFNAFLLSCHTTP